MIKDLVHQDQGGAGTSPSCRWVKVGYIVVKSPVYPRAWTTTLRLVPVFVHKSITFISRVVSPYSTQDHKPVIHDALMMGVFIFESSPPHPIKARRYAMAVAPANLWLALVLRMLLLTRPSGRTRPPNHSPMTLPLRRPYGNPRKHCCAPGFSSALGDTHALALDASCDMLKSHCDKSGGNDWQVSQLMERMFIRTFPKRVSRTRSSARGRVSSAAR